MMKTITIDYEKETLLIKRLQDENFIQVLKKNSKLTSFFMKKAYAEVYFFSSFDAPDLEQKLHNAKKIVVNSKEMNYQLITKFPDCDKKVEIFYPCIENKAFKQKESKKYICEKYNIQEDCKIVLFTAKNFKNNGAKEFFDIASKLNYKNKKVIISGSSEQIRLLKFQIAKKSFTNEILFLEDFDNLDLLFSACDIFVLPTYVKGFCVNVIKAMYYKSAVFVSSNTSSKEVVDVFSRMNSPTDGTTPFKIDALLGRIDDLKQIKKDNHKEATNYLIEHQIVKLLEFIGKFK